MERSNMFSSSTLSGAPGTEPQPYHDNVIPPGVAVWPPPQSQLMAPQPSMAYTFWPPPESQPMAPQPSVAYPWPPPESQPMVPQPSMAYAVWPPPQFQPMAPQPSMPYAVWPPPRSQPMAPPMGYTDWAPPQPQPQHQPSMGYTVWAPPQPQPQPQPQPMTLQPSMGFTPPRPMEFNNLPPPQQMPPPQPQHFTNLTPPPMGFTSWPPSQPQQVLPPQQMPPLPLQLMGLTGNPPMGFTENNSLTYLSTSSPCLDLFFHVVPDTDSDYVTGMLKSCWDNNSLTTLKLICNLRAVRGTGKSDKENFYKAALWLHQHHPKTLACNVGVLAEFGYFKDLPEILFRLLEGPQVRSIAKSEWLVKKNTKGKGECRKMYFLAKKMCSMNSQKTSKQLKKERKNKRKFRTHVPSEERIKENMEKVNDEREKARVLRKERELAKTKKALERYTGDPDYRLLHDKISELFAEHLKFDIQCLNTAMISKISLAAKWCPSIDSAYDKSTLICKNIAKRVFPRENHEEYRGIKEGQYVYRVRDRLRKEVLVPLHKALELPEVYMSGKHWDTLPYKRVASVAMKNYKNTYLQRDNKRFKGYLEDVKTGKAKISAGALLPHEIIASLNDQDGGKVAELQWARMVEDLREKGKLRNCIAVCDVSGSMNGTPMEVCVALGLLISELSEDPWKGKVITFSANPELHKVEGESLLEKTEFVKTMDWGGNTDFQKVFDRILKIGVDGKLSEEQMIKKIFVFSDMEFDQASYAYYGYPPMTGFDSDNGRPRGWETDYEVIERKFCENGYSKVPEIVFWNLRHSSATPVAAKQRGVALVSGFSKNMVTLFLDEDGIVNPEGVMEKAISGELYQKLVVYD